MTPTTPTAETKYQRARALLGAAAETPAAPTDAAPVTALPRDQLRVRSVSRDRVAPIPARLADLLPADHLARLIWDAVARLDLTAFYAPIAVVIGGPGQAATDPQILVARWLYALSQGVTSARRLNDLCVEHLAYIWLCGGVTMNYHPLSDFRVQHLPALDDLLTQVWACLDHADLIAYEHTAQDGMRGRANAGAASFRREATLEKRRAAARTVVAALTAPPAAAAETAARSAREPAA
jgi:transposase